MRACVLGNDQRWQLRDQLSLSLSVRSLSGSLSFCRGGFAQGGAERHESEGHDIDTKTSKPAATSRLNEHESSPAQPTLETATKKLEKTEKKYPLGDRRHARHSDIPAGGCIHTLQRH